jgi:para-aminobenzoate synthetase/4-amino-4-deoxychorismate lyase
VVTRTAGSAADARDARARVGAATAPRLLADQPARFERVPLSCTLSPLDVLRAVRDEPGAFALTGSWAGGGAIVGCRPIVRAGEDADPFAVLADLPRLERGADMPAGAVGGGWFGWLGYRLSRRIERLPDGPPRPVALSDFGLAYYDHVLRLDPDGRWWLESVVAQGRTAAELERRRDRLVAKLASGAPPPARFIPPAPLRLSAAAAEHHLAAIAECRERIAAGEIYQANICLRLETDWDGDMAALFEQARRRIDPPYAAVFCTPWGGIASLSPELFLRRRGADVTTAPIKGTISRDPDQRRARAALAELRASAKDAAEHVMIVDLMRNDLGRVCEYGTVVAPRIPDAEPHPGLWHLVSRVRGLLRPGADDGDLLRATFPPGSVTGAPKVQAMRVIAELERTGREAYTGAIGFVSPVAGLELNVAIRTLELSGGRLWLGVGGGIVADSDPRRELDEALLKGRPIAAAIGSSVAVDGERSRTRPRAATASHPASPDPSLGVFETLHVRDGHVQALERHLERLAASVADLYGERLDADLAGRVRAVAAPLPGRHRLRVRLVPGHVGVSVQIESEPLALPSPRAIPTLEPLPVPGGLGPHKWCDRRLLDRDRDGQSVPLIIDRDDEVLEAAWANVWVLEGSQIVTPPADGRLLPGVTRGLLLELAPALGLTAVVEPVSIARARRADAIFLTSSLRHAVSATLRRPRCAGRASSRAAGPAASRADSVTSPSDSVISMIRAALSDA